MTPSPTKTPIAAAACLCPFTHWMSQASGGACFDSVTAAPLAVVTDVAIGSVTSLCNVSGSLILPVPLGGLEHPANGLGNRCTIHLSYRSAVVPLEVSASCSFQ